MSDSTPNMNEPAAVASEASPAAAVAVLTPDDQSDGYGTLLVVIVLATLAGVCLLISSGQGVEAGHRAWSPNSMLRVLAELMALNYEYPTRRGVEVKWLVQGIGACALFMASAGVWFARSRPGDVDVALASARLSVSSQVNIAQGLLIAYGGWTLLSSVWAPWPEAAVGEGVRQLLGIVWAVTIGRALARRDALRVCGGTVVVLTITAAIGVWYYYERNPLQRLKFPIGNPIFLGACLLPAFFLAAAGVAGALKGSDAGDLESLRVISPRPQRHGLILIGSLVALVFCGWAFYLTGSRGPAVGLGAGVALVLLLLGLRLRGWVGKSLVIVALVCAILGANYLANQFAASSGSRAATMRLRLHAWGYAAEMFAEHPFIGKGQGGYLLGAQTLANADAVHDPAAFGDALLGHAHNEWLEVAADLGVVGLALIVGSLLATLWHTGQAAVRTASVTHAMILMALAGALAAMVVEEAFNVALRMPGLPVVFYLTMGLCWACATAELASTPRRVPNGVRIAGFVGAAALGLVGSNVVIRDWRGALAEIQEIEAADDGKWDEALALSEVAGTQRLGIEDRIAATYQSVQIADNAADDRFASLAAMLRRLKPGEGLTESAAQLVEEDRQRFVEYFRFCQQVGESLLARQPGYPYVAGHIADLWLIEAQVRQLGLWKGLDVEEAVEQALYWRRVEFQRDPLNAKTAFALYRMSPTAPIEARLELLSMPLRKGPPAALAIQQRFALDLMADMESLVAQAAADPEYERVMEARLAVAASITPDTPPVDWPDPFIPEALRLHARSLKLRGDFEAAGRLAARAGELLDALREVSPRSASFARIDQARYAFLQSPDAPADAIGLLEQVIAEWPGSLDRTIAGVTIHRCLAYYLTAADRPADAREVLHMLYAPATDESLDVLFGEMYAELFETFVTFPPDRQPARLDAWRENASAMAEADRLHQMLYRWVRASLFHGDAEAVETALTRLRDAMDDPERFGEVIRSLLSELGAMPILVDVAEKFGIRVSLATQPATQPASQPAAPATSQKILPE